MYVHSTPQPAARIGRFAGCKPQRGVITGRGGGVWTDEWMTGSRPKQH